MQEPYIIAEGAFEAAVEIETMRLIAEALQPVAHEPALVDRVLRWAIARYRLSPAKERDYARKTPEQAVREYSGGGPVG